MHVSSLSRIDSFLRVIKKFLLRAFEICTAIPLYYSPLLGYDSLSLSLSPSPFSSSSIVLRARSISRIVSSATCDIYPTYATFRNILHPAMNDTLITPSISFLVPSLYVLSLLLDETRTMHFKRARVENLYLSLSLDQRIVKLITSHA